MSQTLFSKDELPTVRFAALENRLNEGLKMLRCAQANLENLVQAVPAISYVMAFKVVKLQMEQAVESLESKTERSAI